MIDEHIVENAASLVGDQRVTNQSLIDSDDAPREQPIEKLGRSLALESQTPHMRDIKDADRVSRCIVFRDDRRILNRHRPARKVHHSRVTSDVPIVQRRTCERIRHEATPRSRSAMPSRKLGRGRRQFVTDVQAFYPIRRRPLAGRTNSVNDDLTISAHARCALLSAFSQIPTSSLRLRNVVGGVVSQQRRTVPDIRPLKGRLPAGGLRIVTESHCPVRFGHDSTQARMASSLSSLHSRSTSPRRVPPQLGTNETSMLSSMS